MAPKKGMKRAETTHEATAEKKTKIEKPTKSVSKPKTLIAHEATPSAPAKVRPKADLKFQPVIDAIKQATDLTESCRQLLLSTIACSFGTPYDVRHEVQHECVQMVGEVVNRVATSLQKAVDEQQAKVEELEKSKVHLFARQQAAANLVVMAAAAEDGKKHALAEAERSLADAKAALQEKQDTQRSGDAALEEADAHRAILTIALAAPLKSIMHEELDSAALANCYNDLKPAVQLLKDESLTAAVPVACGRPKSQRAVFDNMVIEQFEKTLIAKKDELSSFLGDGVVAKQQHAEAVQVAKTKLDGAEALSKTLADALAESHAAWKKASDDASCAKAAVDRCESQMMKTVQLRDTKRGEFEDFKQRNLGAFELLRDTISKQIVAPQADEPIQ